MYVNENNDKNFVCMYKMKTFDKMYHEENKY